MAHARLGILGLVLTLVALMTGGCGQQKSSAATNVESVMIDGEWFHLELALDPASRFQGLSGRTHIDEDGGMLFVFPRPAVQAFVMRDCPIPIDIIFLDPAGRIVAMHQMTVEEPRREDEPETGNGATDKYEQRLKRYPSKFAAQFVIELAGGTLDDLEIAEGDLIKLDTEGLKARAK
ncbi:MAG TPA: DUF192 domain-containing protein [Phycisphaerales bacterium]|nr:DUF192 domain-containing protein [Phycisphaerales bacterium]